MTNSQSPTRHQSRKLPIMRPLSAIAALAAFTLAPLPHLRAQLASTVDTSAARAGSIDGIILPPAGMSGKSTSSLTVTIVETNQTARTDKYGHYSFPKVTPGTYTLLVTGDGFSRLRITDVVVAPGHELTISAQAMAYVVKNGEVQMMEEVVVHANKDVEVMEKYVVTGVGAGEKPPAFSGSNFDLPRGIDDVQPYYIWDKNQIANSGASNVQDFFQKMVPMATNRGSSAQLIQPGYGDTSNITLGGLGSNNYTSTGTQNTLILLNGLPLPATFAVGSVLQPNVNGIPLNAIDHIEVLPSSASAIYGANATGGVVNIILKHDYAGGEVGYTYNNTFGTDAPTRNLSLTWGQSLEGGKTNIFLAASYQTGKPLVLQDRTQVIGPYNAKYFSLYPAGELAYVGILTTAGAVPTTNSAVYLNTPFVRSTSNKPLIAGNTATQLQIPAGYQSYQANGIAPLQANIGNYDLARSNTAVFGLGLAGNLAPVAQGPLEKGVNLMIRRQMTPWLEAFVQASNSSDTNDTYQTVPYMSAVTVPATAPGNPFNQAVTVSSGNAYTTPQFYVYNTLTRTLSAGLKLTLPRDWKAELDYTWGGTYTSVFEISQDPPALQGAVNKGLVNVITDLSQHPLNMLDYVRYLSYSYSSTNNSLQLKTAGPLMKLWAGAPTLAVGLSHVKAGVGFVDDAISYPDEAIYGLPTGTLALYLLSPGQSQSNDSSYAELDFPVIDRSNRIPGIRRLELQAVGRYDRFQEFTTSPGGPILTYLVNGTINTSPNYLNGQREPFFSNPVANYHATTGTVGFKYYPVDDLFFRWSFTTGFDSPTYSQLQAPISTGDNVQSTGAYPGVPTTAPWPYQSITDPLLNATYTVPVETGGNPNLVPETSRAIAWGLVFEPTFVKGLRISVDFSKVTKYNNIVSPTAALLVANAASFPGRVMRSSPTGPVIFINATAMNAPSVYTSSYNIQADYTWRSATLGSFKLSGIANSWQHYVIQSTIGAAFVEQLGNPITSGGVNALGQYTGIGGGLAKFKGNLGLDWSKGRFSAGWFARYTGPYTQGTNYGIGGAAPYVVGTVNGWIPGQIYHDVYVGYRVDGASATDPWWVRALSNTNVRFSVTNVFGKIPPYDGTNSFPLLYSLYGDIRLASYILSVKKSF
jgi:outer membrane receptor protein involved in Fe transport